MKKRRRAIAEMNVVPYIDVMLVLLVIFMITSPLLSQGVKVDLPQAAAQTLSSEQEEPLIISVDKSGLYYLNDSTNPDTPMAPADLALEVAAKVRLSEQRQHPRLVLVKGDKAVAYEKVITAMALINHAGVKQVGLMTQSVEDVS